MKDSTKKIPDFKILIEADLILFFNFLSLPFT